MARLRLRRARAGHQTLREQVDHLVADVQAHREVGPGEWNEANRLASQLVAEFWRGDADHALGFGMNSKTRHRIERASVCCGAIRRTRSVSAMPRRCARTTARLGILEQFHLIADRRLGHPKPPRRAWELPVREAASNTRTAGGGRRRIAIYKHSL